MFNRTGRAPRLRSAVFGGIGALVAAVLGASVAQAQTSYSSGSFPGPSVSAHPLAIILAKGYDKKNGYSLDWQIRTTGAAFYNDLFTGVYNGILFSGLDVMAKQYNKGVPIRIVSGSAAYPWPVVVRADSGINKISDLRGKTVGFPKVSYIWAYLTLVLKHHGLDIDKDVKVINLNIIQAINLLERGDYDAATVLTGQTIDLFSKAPGKFRVLFFPDDEVAKILGRGRMYQATAMRADFIDKNPQVVKGVLQSVREAQALLDNDIEEAIKILGPKTKITGAQGSGGASLKEHVVRSMYKDGFAGRTMRWFAVPAKDLKDIFMAEFQIYKDLGIIEKVPDEGIFHLN